MIAMLVGAVEDGVSRLVIWIVVIDGRYADKVSVWLM